MKKYFSLLFILCIAIFNCVFATPPEGLDIEATLTDEAMVKLAHSNPHYANVGLLRNKQEIGSAVYIGGRTCLTAAHCIVGNGFSFFVQFETEQGPQSYEIKQSLVYPAYDGKHHDLAVLMLDRPVEGLAVLQPSYVYGKKNSSIGLEKVAQEEHKKMIEIYNSSRQQRITELERIATQYHADLASLTSSIEKINQKIDSQIQALNEPHPLCGKRVTVVGYGYGGTQKDRWVIFDNQRRAAQTQVDYVTSIIEKQPDGCIFSYPFLVEETETTDGKKVLRTRTPFPYETSMREGMSGGAYFVEDEFVGVNRNKIENPLTGRIKKAFLYGKRLLASLVLKSQRFLNTPLPLSLYHPEQGSIGTATALGGYQVWIEGIRSSFDRGEQVEDALSKDLAIKNLNSLFEDQKANLKQASTAS